MRDLMKVDDLYKYKRISYLQLFYKYQKSSDSKSVFRKNIEFFQLFHR